jgi:hypothetical protein
MIKYNVHAYREMRLVFEGIEAGTPEAAASLVRNKPAADADEVVDCDGETFCALVDHGDEDDDQYEIIDFQGQRMRDAAPKLLAACRLVVERLEHGDLAEAARACADAIADAEARCPPVVPAASERNQD